jgi:glutamate racemase
MKGLIAEIMGKKVCVINSAEAVAEEVKNFLKANPEIEKGIKKGESHQFFFSDEPYNFEKISRLCFGQKIATIIQDSF